MAKANDGEGPDILRSARDGGTNGHAESLAATLAEHQQHLASFQVLINQLKDVAPAIQKSISDCTEKINNVSSILPIAPNHHARASSVMQAQTSGRTMESISDDVAEVTSNMSSMQLDRVYASPPTLKLPQLFSLTPSSSGKSGNMQRRQTSQSIQMENLSERSSLDQPLLNSRSDHPPIDTDTFYVQNLKRSVREAALAVQSSNSESSRDSHSDEGLEHFFLPLSAAGLNHLVPEKKVPSVRGKRLLTSQMDSGLFENHAFDGKVGSKFNDVPHILNDLDSINECDSENGFFSAAGSNGTWSDGQRAVYDTEEPQDEVFSPPLLMDPSLMADSYEDLLAPLSEIETALMEH